MSFVERDFFVLSKENRFKKIVYAIKEYLAGLKEERFVVDLIEWLNKYENYDYRIPDNKVDWMSLYKVIFENLVKENPFIEKEPFDNIKRERKVFQIKVILDNIRSPFNVGSIVRTSEALGVEEIIMCGITPVLEKNDKIAKTAKNSNVECCYFKKTIEAVLLLKNQGYSIYSIEKTISSIEIKNFKPQFPFAVIFGNEEFGISKEILKESDNILHINMLGVKNSINVAVASGIALFELTRYL